MGSCYLKQGAQLLLCDDLEVWESSGCWREVQETGRMYILKAEIAGVTGKFGLGEQNEAGQNLTQFCQENALVIPNNLLQQHKRRLYTCTPPDGQY